MKTRAQLDLRCYVVTGNGSQDDIVATAAQAAAGGAGVIQVRSKPIEAGQLLKLAVKVSLAVAEANPATKILIDDRVDIAAILMRRGLPVHGVHVGQSDIPVTDVRELLGPDAIIGLTTGTAELIQQANEYADIIDYVGGYPRLVELSQLPIVAIGDVQPADVTALASTGIAGVAMVRAFIEAPSATELAQQIIADFSAGLQMSGATS